MTISMPYNNYITLRPPGRETPTFVAPTTDWLAGTWHITHSTLPMWKSKRNVTITYNPLPATLQSTLGDTDDTSSTPSTCTNKLEDIVTCQNLNSSKTKTVNGIDTAGGIDASAWDRLGKGWLKVSSSHWEVLGWGDLDGGNQWVVTYFSQTAFTPAGVDVYSRKREGLEEEVVAEITEELKRMKRERVINLAVNVFEVAID